MLVNQSQVLVKSHTITDWLDLHGLDASTVKAALSDLENSLSRISYDGAQQSIALSAEEVWSITSRALTDCLPNLFREIEFVRDYCERVFATPSEELPYTLDRGPDQAPFVSLNYQGTSADVLCIAHEFGHALQYHLAQGEFIPPANRELAAFVSELVLLDYLPELQTPLESSWSDDSFDYFGEDADQLKSAIERHDTPYNYRWNYPLSRFVSDMLFEALTKTEMARIFRGEIAFSDLVEKAHQLFNEAEKESYLPEVPTSDKACPTRNAYSSLGMMVLLDLEAGQADEKIETYYSERLQHMRERTAQVVLDELRRPIGYAIWERGTRTSDQTRIVHQSTPFGDHPEVNSKLQDAMLAIAECSAPDQNPMRCIDGS